MDDLLSDAVSSYDDGDFTAAEEACRGYLTRVPDDPDGICLMGALLMESGRLEEAEHYVLEAAEASPRQACFHALLAQIEWLSGDVPAAFLAAEHALELDANEPQALSISGKCHFDRHENDRAIELFRRLVRIQPDDWEAWHFLGTLHLEEEHADSAVECLKQSLEFNPSSAGTLNNLGTAFKMQGRIGAAAVQYRKALQVDPHFSDAFNNLGGLLKACGEMDAAAASFEAAIRLCPDDPMLKLNYAGLLSAMGRFDDALVWYERVCAEDPDNKIAKHFRSALRGETPEHAPLEYIRGLFDDFSKNFEHKLVGHLEYHVPEALRAVLVDYLESGQSIRRCVDLGCGTGLCGERLRDLVEEMIGVDVSPKMLAKARQKECYDQLLCGDLAGVLSQLKGTIDLFVAGDVLIYIGDLEGLFRTMAGKASPNALLLFSCESCEQNFIIKKTGRFAHSREYIERIGKATGWTILKTEETNVRKERGEWIPGRLYLMKLG